MAQDFVVRFVSLRSGDVSFLAEQNDLLPRWVLLGAGAVGVEEEEEEEEEVSRVVDESVVLTLVVVSLPASRGLGMLRGPRVRQLCSSTGSLGRSRQR